MTVSLGSKTLTFIAVMAALGNVLSFISIQLAPIAPSIPLGPVAVSLAFDLSHIATFIAALFGGPIVGGMTGLIGGLVAAFEFGFGQGNIITGITLPIGKALTGITAGLIFSRLSFSKNWPIFLVTTIFAYIPEAIFTAFIFMVVFPALLSMPQIIVNAITVQILIKAFIEMAIMGIILAGLYSNKAFYGYALSYFPKKNISS